MIIRSEYGTFAFEVGITPEQLASMNDEDFAVLYDGLGDAISRAARQYLFEQMYGHLPTNEQWAKVKKLGLANGN